MASDQIEYCGQCKNFLKCRKLAKAGKLFSCKINDKPKRTA